MRIFPLSPAEMFLSFWRNRHLIKTLTKREVIGRYRGSLLGILWSFFNPLFMLAVYTFVFSVVFQSRWRAESSSKTEFSLILFAGLIVFNLFTECLTRSSNLILSNANYVKKVVFPLEILPWVALGSALFHALVSWSVWMIAYSIFFGIAHLTIVFLPLIFLPLIFFVIGFTWLLSSLGVYLRDVSQIVGVLINISMFISPVFYPVTALPEGVRHVIQLNPLTPIIEQTRDVMFWGKYPDFGRLGMILIVSLITAWLGFVWFQKTRKGFADVI